MSSMKRAIKILALAATAGMFAVLVMGATVTNTGSEHGCGKSWPLCHGKLIPQFAVGTAIEFSHRAIVGVESILILLLAGGAFYLYGRRRETQILVPIMVLFLFLQAALGAWAVMYPQLSAVLALHFGVSLIAFASVLLTAAYILEIDGRDRLRDRGLPISLRRFVWALAAYSYVVVYLGAYVRHTNADEGCTGWPLCNGAVIPVLHDKVTAAFAHRLAAGILVLAVLGLLLWTARFGNDRPDIYRAAQLAFGFVILQAAAGAAVVWTDLDLFAALAHAALVGLMFGALTYLCMHVMPRSAARESVRQPAALRAAADTASAPH